MFVKYILYLIIQAKEILKAKQGSKCRLRVVTMVKSEKGRIRWIKFSITILFNLDNIDKANNATENTKQRIVFELEYSKLNEMYIFCKITDIEWRSSLF